MDAESKSAAIFCLALGGNNGYAGGGLLSARGLRAASRETRQPPCGQQQRETRQPKWRESGGLHPARVLHAASRQPNGKVRDELEHLLDDDVDMAAMHLSDKLAADGQSSRCNTNSEPNEFDEERDREAEAGDGSSEGANGSGTGTSVGFTPKIDELENLLEAYFVQADGTLNKLSTLREYVDDTEDYINVMLDDKQNQLLQVGILLSTATLVMSVAIAITGVFGMNITIPLYNAPTGVFWQVTGGLVVATAAVYVVALICYKRSGILQ